MPTTTPRPPGRGQTNPQQPQSPWAPLPPIPGAPAPVTPAVDPQAATAPPGPIVPPPQAAPAGPVYPAPIMNPVPQLQTGGPSAGQFAPTPQLPGGAEAGQRIEDALMDRARRLLEPQFAQQQRQLEQRLANQGLAVGGEAYDTDMTLRQDAENRAWQDVASQAVMAGTQEQQRLLDQQFRYDQMAMQSRMQELALQAQQGNAAAQQELAQLQFQAAQQQQQFANEMAQLQFGHSSGLQDRQQYFNEMGWFLGGGVPMIQGVQANAPNVGSAYGNYQNGLNNQYTGQLNQWQYGQQQGQDIMSLLGMFGMMSSETVKTGITPVDGPALEQAIRGLDVKAWFYHDDPANLRLGPIAEHTDPVFSTGQQVNLASILFASVVTLQRVMARLDQLEARP